MSVWPACSTVGSCGCGIQSINRLCAGRCSEARARLGGSSLGSKRPSVAFFFIFCIFFWQSAEKIMQKIEKNATRGVLYLTERVTYQDLPQN